MDKQQKIWRAALEQLTEIDKLWDDQQLRHTKILNCRDWMERQNSIPRLSSLSPLMSLEMSRSQFWSVLVPVERAVTRLRVTDMDILEGDLTEGARQGESMPVKVVVDSMRSAFNVGGILRSSECFGVDEVILCGYSPQPDHAQVARAALGSGELVRWRHIESIREAIAVLIAEGITCYALETVAGAPSIDTVHWKLPCALVVGNERFGLDPDVVKLCDGGAVRIQLYGSKNSLNVVSALSVAAYQVRQTFHSS